MTGRGSLYGVGVGPGDTELLTLKAARLLHEVKVIAYPVAEGSESLARSIVAPLIPESAIELPIAFPIRDSGPPAAAYDAGAARIRVHLDAAENVLFLCEGDPFLYGSFMYIHQRLAGDYKTIVVPGVSSLTACAAALGRPLAARLDVLKVLPALLPEARLREELKSAEAAAIIKVGRSFTKVRQVLRDLGLEPHAALVENATQAGETVYRLADVPDAHDEYFSTILVYRGGQSWQ
jgi:precorrin-2/cobalt-factor-2 C20-methyltransferase